MAKKRKGPAPESAFKVGESTVELAAYYFAEVCGLKDHIESRQLEKNGLRFFFPKGDNSDITGRVEWGSTHWLDVPSYQLDRGRFENEIAERCLRAGADVRDGCVAEDVEFGSEGHKVALLRDGETSTVTARWVVDATGRAFLLKRKLGLAKDVEHSINSAWFRLANGLDIEAWGADNETWMSRMDAPGLRKFSTNHLMGEGYWVWLIPLASGVISIGIVADPRFHPFEQINTLDAAFEWLKRHEPQLSSALEGRRDDVEDFLRIQHFAHGCERVFSPERWCLTGEAGVFLDPFYSPGSDFIAMSNTYITDLIARDLAGEDIARRAEVFNGVYVSTFDAILESVYLDQYAAFGNAQVLVAKIVWDYFNYWSMNSFRFMHGKLCDLAFTGEIGPGIHRVLALSARVGQLFRDWNMLDRQEWQDAFVEGRKLPALWDRHLELAVPFDGDEALKARFLENVRLIEALAVLIFYKAATSVGYTLAEDREINPAGISLDPDRWEQDGLFEGPGLTPAAAREMLPGFEHMWLDERVGTPAEQLSAT